MLKLTSWFLLFIPLLGFSQISKEETQTFYLDNGTAYTYKKPKLLEVIKYAPRDLAELGKFTLQKENLLWTSLTFGSTVALIPFDQKLLENAMELGEPIGWNKDATYDRLFGVLELFPRDINAAVYFLGNGVTTLLIGGTFYSIGKINNDFRALNTANELVEILISTGLTTQILKRISGRQSPSAAIESGNAGGHWTPFPSFKSFQTETPNYDAFPSGHVATMMATITVISTNYPDAKWVKPIGYSLMGLMAFEMMSARVHWISDYPLAILIGYVIGKNAANRRIDKNFKRDLTDEIIKPRFKTNFGFTFDSEFKMLKVTVVF
ncbi:PAP2 superfamily protein [Mariniflexile fucanivorans]|uniref:PAP2 superfamily protein n=1 Tax=Mariniflexile fucanivorans TaxID=264023 RepID=A0A4R1RIW4_9FLAO|nr:phosphatase PAP2 family protein [Mariniflexile fucanivorans]TCL66053.1 PAP2 superfamily protein [Mariniflexile fucanivorans]